jgi:hypothetical protein
MNIRSHFAAALPDEKFRRIGQSVEAASLAGHQNKS